MANAAAHPGPLQTAARAAAGIASNGPLVAALAVPLALGSIAGAATLRPILTWYRRLRKPRWTPRAPIIGNTWSVLYSCMGAASYLVWKKTGIASGPMVLYAAQLGLNVAWQLIFFRGRAVETAQKENAVLLAAVAATTVSFWRVDPAAGKLMLPYLAFTGFANALNYSILKKNPEEVEKEEERQRSE